MSEPQSALGGAFFEGIARIEELGPRGMITLRGDLSSKKLQKAASALAGVDFPGPRQASCVEDQGLAWMSPDELLLMVPHGDAEAAIAEIGKALKGSHHLAVNVSDARALFAVAGPGARAVLAKLCPVDLAPGAFGPGDFRRTRAAQVPVAFWMPEAEMFELICFRSVARYVFDLLATAAGPGGEVGYFPSGA